MFRAQTAPAPVLSTRRPSAFLLRERRDPRRFGQARLWTLEAPDIESESADDLRLFAHSFAAFFLFFSLLIA